MASRNIELYEALKTPVGEDAARMIAEVVPAADDLATKEFVREQIAIVRDEIASAREGAADLRSEMHREFSAMKTWFIASMVPLWLGVYGTLITLIVQR